MTTTSDLVARLRSLTEHAPKEWAWVLPAAAAALEALLKAKAENDERFQLEARRAESQRDVLASVLRDWIAARDWVEEEAKADTGSAAPYVRLLRAEQAARDALRSAGINGERKE